MSNRSLSAPDFCHIKHASHATASLLGGMPRIPSFGTTGPYLKASFDESADGTGPLVVNAARLYMYAFMTHCDVCLRVGEPLGGARFCNGSTGTKAMDLEAKWGGHKGTMIWTDVCSIDEKGKQSMYHTVSLHMCLCHSWFQYIFSEVRHFNSRCFQLQCRQFNRTDPVRSKAINAEIFANDTWVWGSSLSASSASSASCNFSFIFVA